MKYTYLALISHVVGQAEIPSGVGTGDIGFLDTKDPSKRKPIAQQSDQTVPGPYGQYAGNIGSESKLGAKKEVTDLADMPYGPLWKKKHAWETTEEARPGYQPPKNNIKNAY